MAYMAPAESHCVTVTFQLPAIDGRPLQELYPYKVITYWTRALGHEGPGSLLSALKGRLWATAVNAGNMSTPACNLVIPRMA